MSYQEKYDYGDYYEYSQLSYEGPQMYDQDYYHAQYTFDQYGYEWVTQQPTLHYQSHKSESLDEMMRKRHMVHVEKELIKPHLSMEERVELLEWKYDLLPKEVKEMRPGTSILEKRQAKQHWIYVQIEQMTPMGDVEEKVVSPPELETELLGPNEEYTIEIIVEEPPMESKVEGLLLDEPIKVDYNSPAVVVMETKSVKDACLETRKVALHDVGDFIHKLCLWESLDLLGTENEVVKWRVNYRAFVGNSVGKCGFKEFCKERWDVTKHTHNRRIKHRAYISNEKGKCALRPP